MPVYINAVWFFFHFLQGGLDTHLQPVNFKYKLQVTFCLKGKGEGLIIALYSLIKYKASIYLNHLEYSKEIK